LRATFLSEICEQEEKARKSFLARIEQLVDQILLNSTVPGQEIRHKQLGKFWFFEVDPGAGTRDRRS
jgi:hypothetical protein